MPGPEEIVAVLTGVPGSLDRSGEGGVNGSLIGPAARIARGELAHSLDGLAIGGNHGIVGVHAADVAAHKQGGRGRGLHGNHGVDEERQRGCCTGACEESPAVDPGSHWVTFPMWAQAGWSACAFVFAFPRRRKRLEG